MNVNNIINMSCFLLLFFSCGKPTLPHVNEAHRIMNKVSKENAKEGFSVIAFGGAFFDQINEFMLTYKYYTDEMTIDRSREILVERVESLLSIVNNDIQVRPYLKNYPYSENYLYFKVSFGNSSTFYLDKDNISLVKVVRGTVIYSIYNGHLYESIYEEPYSVAYEKVYGRPLPERGCSLEP